MIFVFKLKNGKKNLVKMYFIRLETMKKIKKENK
jgi:hypothetical protein